MRPGSAPACLAAGVRVWAAGEIMSAQRAAQLRDEGCDVVPIGRAGILQRDFPLQVEADPPRDSPKLPVTAGYLRAGDPSECFISHMRSWPRFGEPTSR